MPYCWMGTEFLDGGGVPHVPVLVMPGGGAEAVWCPLYLRSPGRGIHRSFFLPSSHHPLLLLFLEVPGKAVATHKPIPASRDVVWLTQPFIYCCLCPEGRGVL